MPRILLFLAALGASPAWAHHGFRGYETEPVKLSGVVGAVKYENPHVSIELRVPGPPAETLTVLFPPPWSMISRGLPQSALVPGKSVMIEGYRHRHDPHELLAKELTMDGTTAVFRGDLSDTELSHAMRSDPWLFPVVEIFHIVCFAIVVGTSAVLDLRLLGFAQKLRVTTLAKLLQPMALGAFGVVALTGGLLFLADPNDYLTNRAFQIKMALIVISGLNALHFQRTTFKGCGPWDVGARPPPRARAAGALSLAVWVGVIVAGRMIAFV